MVGRYGRIACEELTSFEKVKLDELEMSCSVRFEMLMVLEGETVSFTVAEKVLVELVASMLYVTNWLED